jgi:hypothetical protein
MPGSLSMLTAEDQPLAFGVAASKLRKDCPLTVAARHRAATASKPSFETLANDGNHV